MKQAIMESDVYTARLMLLKSEDRDWYVTDRVAIIDGLKCSVSQASDGLYEIAAIQRETGNVYSLDIE